MPSLRTLMLMASLVCLTACGGGGGSGQSTPPVVVPPALSLKLEQVVSGLSGPVFLTAPSGDARLFVVEQPGRIRIVKNGALLSAPFLDVSAKLSSGGERGLLSMVFDPNYATNGNFFIYFTHTLRHHIVIGFRGCT